jgi:hypothetical protein
MHCTKMPVPTLDAYETNPADPKRAITSVEPSDPDTKKTRKKNQNATPPDATPTPPSAFFGVNR